MYRNVETLYYTPHTNMTLYANHIDINIHKKVLTFSKTLENLEEMENIHGPESKL